MKSETLYIIEVKADIDGDFRPSETFKGLFSKENADKAVADGHEVTGGIFRYRATPAVEVIEITPADVVKAGIKDTDIQKLLPFLTSVSSGDNHFHIRNDSVYPVKTQYHVIEEGDTLCKRFADNSDALYGTYPTCPGCIAKAKNIIANFILNGKAGE